MFILGLFVRRLSQYWKSNFTSHISTTLVSNRKISRSRVSHSSYHFLWVKMHHPRNLQRLCTQRQWSRFKSQCLFCWLPSRCCWHMLYECRTQTHEMPASDTFLTHVFLTVILHKPPVTVHDNTSMARPLFSSVHHYITVVTGLFNTVFNTVYTQKNSTVEKKNNYFLDSTMSKNGT